MKFAKTFCAPGSVISMIPAGLPIKLQYNEFGLLQKYTIGLDISLDPIYEDSDAGEFDYNKLFEKIRQVVPKNVSVTGGTTWVYGVLYSDKIPCDEGVIPQALYKSYIKDIINGSSCVFYAGYVKSLAASFIGPVVVRNFLASNKFEALPQTIVPIAITDDTIEMLIKSSNNAFKRDFIAGFFIFEDSVCRYANMNLLQLNVSNEVTPFVDADGFLKGEVVTKSGRSYIMQYPTIVKYGIEKGCSLLVERHIGEIDGGITVLANRLSSTADKVVDTMGKDVKCPVCRKLYKVYPSNNPIQCDDPHCLSHEYANACKLLKTLKLPEMSYNSYKALVDSKTIICITDLLDLPPCQDIEIKTTLPNALFAAIPTSVVPNQGILERFANKCNNKIDTVIYYLNSPLRIETDFDITDPIVRRLATWLEDPYNLSTVTTVLSYVTIEEKCQKFDGDPIFRGNRIAVTGKFKHGDYEEIKSILTSYAAEVVSSIEIGDPLPDVLLIGGLNEGISGQMVQKAKIHDIPITYEDDFFIRYQIDEDIVKNTL